MLAEVVGSTAVVENLLNSSVVNVQCALSLTLMVERTVSFTTVIKVATYSSSAIREYQLIED